MKWLLFLVFLGLGLLACNSQEIALNVLQSILAGRLPTPTQLAPANRIDIRAENPYFQRW